jgi:hypothetical protein
VELQNFKKMTDLLAENVQNFWKIVVLRKIFRAFFSENISSTSPPIHPPPRRQYFPGKIFAFRKKFFEGALEWKGPKFWTTPPNQKPVGTALDNVVM